MVPGEYFDDFEKEIQKKSIRVYKSYSIWKSRIYICNNLWWCLFGFGKRELLGVKHYLGNNDTKNIGKVIEDITLIAKSGEGYYFLIFKKKPDTNEPTHKISFYKGLSKWNWLIGTGFYEDDALSRIEDRKRKIDEKYEA